MRPSSPQPSDDLAAIAPSDSLLERITDAFIALDAGWRFVYVNARAAQIFGRSREELLGKNLWAEMPEGVGKAFYKAYHQAMAEQMPLQIEEYSATRGRWFENHIYPSPNGLSIFFRDITERRQMEEALRESETRLRTIAETSPVAMTMTRWHDSALLYANRHFREMFAMPLASDLSNVPSLSIYVNPADRRKLQAALSEKDHVKDYEILCQRRDGTPVWVSGSFQRTVYNGEDCIFSAYYDITRRKRIEEALRASEVLFRTIAETTPAAMTITRWDDGAIFYANQHVRNLFGVAPQEDLTQHQAAEFYAHPADRERLMRALSDQDYLQHHETLFQKIDGTTFWGNGSYQRLDFYGEPALFAAFYDITERKRLLEQAQEEAERDPLTGLLNHRAFHRRFEEEALRALGDGYSLAVAILDLDNFKFFNDFYGHTTGDDVLRQVAEALRAASRAHDTLARFGGDEFAMLLPEVGAEVTADEIAARLESGLREVSYRPSGYGSAIPIRLSVGVALFPADAPNRSAVMQLADERLLRAKTGGLSGGEAQQVRVAMQDVQGFPMLDALVNAVDNKDRYTRRHSEDVMVYSLLIARELGMDAAAQRTLRVAALLHDVGKIGVPDAILRKPGALTPEEFASIQQHPVMGAVIVTTVPNMKDTLDCVRSHHERWDGEGYPDRKRGEDTPLPARLMAVADAYSAMTSDRPYRKGKTPTQAQAILEAGAGAQWDPACVKALLRALHGGR